MERQVTFDADNKWYFDLQSSTIIAICLSVIAAGIIKYLVHCFGIPNLRAQRVVIQCCNRVSQIFLSKTKVY